MHDNTRFTTHITLPYDVRATDWVNDRVTITLDPRSSEDDTRLVLEGPAEAVRFLAGEMGIAVEPA